MSDYKLTDLLSSAGATIGIIIAGTIFLQFLSTKYVELSGRFRTLTHEYRGPHASDPRHVSLQTQIHMLRCRLRLINWASCFGAVALLSFILAVIAGGFSIVYPETMLFKWLGSFGLLSGLVLIAAAVLLELVESVFARRELTDESDDLDDAARLDPD